MNFKTSGYTDQYNNHNNSLDIDSSSNGQQYYTN
jgi:hypothetical protein